MHSISYGSDSIKIEELKSYSKLVLLMDERTVKFCKPLLPKWLKQSADQIVVEQASETTKTIKTCEWIWNEMLHLHMDRRSLLINLGGGLISDIGGFCAATYKRRIDFINIPTTLLGMVDAAIGGKTGVNFNESKNQIGTFSLPKQVILDTRFLQSLSKAELKSGLGEVLKYALIKQPSIISKLEETKGIIDDEILKLCVDIKLNIAKNDPFEKGERKALNFGHTIGHALESISYHTSNPLKHGEAVAWGMLAESFISKKMGFSELEKVEHLISEYFHKPNFSEYSIADTLPHVLNDKKNIGTEIHCCLLQKIGDSIPDCIVTISEIEQALIWLGCK